MVSELVGSAREAAKGLAKFLADDERGGEVLIEDFHVLVSAMGALNSAADRIEALEAELAAENEACAAECDKQFAHAKKEGVPPLTLLGIKWCRDAIRARSRTTEGENG